MTTKDELWLQPMSHDYPVWLVGTVGPTIPLCLWLTSMSPDLIIKLSLIIQDSRFFLYLFHKFMTMNSSTNSYYDLMNMSS